MAINVIIHLDDRGGQGQAAAIIDHLTQTMPWPLKFTVECEFVESLEVVTGLMKDEEAIKKLKWRQGRPTP